MTATNDTRDDVIDLGAASEITLGFNGSPVEALTIPDRQDKQG